MLLRVLSLRAMNEGKQNKMDEIGNSASFKQQRFRLKYCCYVTKQRGLWRWDFPSPLLLRTEICVTRTFNWTNPSGAFTAEEKKWKRSRILRDPNHNVISVYIIAGWIEHLNIVFISYCLATVARQGRGYIEIRTEKWLGKILTLPYRNRVEREAGGVYLEIYTVCRIYTDRGEQTTSEMPISKKAKTWKWKKNVFKRRGTKGKENMRNLFGARLPVAIVTSVYPSV